MLKVYFPEKSDVRNVSKVPVRISDKQTFVSS